jgi:hypothetical protein
MPKSKHRKAHYRKKKIEKKQSAIRQRKAHQDKHGSFTL